MPSRLRPRPGTRCPSCRAENSDAARFCEQCGSRLARRCFADLNAPKYVDRAERRARALGVQLSQLDGEVGFDGLPVLVYRMGRQKQPQEFGEIS
jgi:hypothetical protein